jgi:hypothetical protein
MKWQAVAAKAGWVLMGVAGGAACVAMLILALAPGL